MKKKLTNDDYLFYWKNIHIKTKNDLASVCFPDRPFFFNQFFDRTQKYAINKSLKLLDILIHNKKVLDLGCGRGRWLEFFNSKGASSIGIDLSEIAVNICNTKGLTAINGSIINMPFSSEEFDIISSITVLLHLPFDLKKKAISELSRVLKPGGIVILLEGTWKDTAPHVYSYSLNEWEEIFKLNNLNLIHANAHCFNFIRRNLNHKIPFYNLFSIYLDYPIEFLLMNLYKSKSSKHSLQHVMIFKKV